MKNKQLMGTIAAIAVVCAILIFNIAVFPAVLAATPGNSDIQRIVEELAALPEPTTELEPTLGTESPFAMELSITVPVSVFIRRSD